ncbi:MAG: hypothetical protein ACLFTH_00260 [Candidatus Woesearchaeota archaeon]
MRLDEKFAKKTDYIKHFGEELGWKPEQLEFVNAIKAGGYQTADNSDENPYPEPIKRLKLTIEKQSASLEETYYWCLDFLRTELGFPMVEKIYDIFSASESSAQFGNTGQKQSIQQDRASQYLQYIGQFVKQLFQLVRELRVIDEKLQPYKDWRKSKSADITLKQVFTQFAEGSPQNPSPDTVYQLAQRIGYTVLPDLFFNTHIYDLKKVDQEVDNGQTKEFNKQVRTVLKRKLYQFLNWKEKTEKELYHRRKFLLQYLRQHWKIIQLYMSWIKPYIRTARRLASNPNHLESPEIINAFDTTKLEIEVLAKKPIDMKKNDGHYSCVLLNFKFTTQPKLTYDQRFQSQAVAHTGRCTVTFRSYGWHESDIEAYRKMRDREDVDMLKTLDEHISGAFDYLGEEFEKYLEEAQEEFTTEKKSEEKKKKEKGAQEAKDLLNKKHKYRKWGPLEPFLNMGDGLEELAKSFFSAPKADKSKMKSEPSKTGDKEKKKKAGGNAAKSMGVLYTVYKKSHQHLAW